MQNDLFEKWYSLSFPNSSLERNEDGSYFRRKTNFSLESFKAGAQSRQAEIDKLQKDNEGYRKLVNYDTQEMEKLHNKIDELKERIDDAIYDLQHIESKMWEEQVDHVLMILKGNQS